jgi:hypothetical protein
MMDAAGLEPASFEGTVDFTTGGIWRPRYRMTGTKS